MIYKCLIKYSSCVKSLHWGERDGHTDLHEASLIYILSFRPARATRLPCLKTNTHTLEYKLRLIIQMALKC